MSIDHNSVCTVWGANGGRTPVWHGSSTSYPVSLGTSLSLYFFNTNKTTTKKLSFNDRKEIPDLGALHANICLQTGWIHEEWALKGQDKLCKQCCQHSTMSSIIICLARADTYIHTHTQTYTFGDICRVGQTN